MYKKWSEYTRNCKRCGKFYSTPYKTGKICGNCNQQVNPDIRNPDVKTTRELIIDELKQGSKRLKELEKSIDRARPTIVGNLSLLKTDGIVEKVKTPRVESTYGKVHRSFKYMETRYKLVIKPLEAIYLEETIVNRKT